MLEVVDRRSSYRVTFVTLAAGVGAFALLQSLISPVLPLLQTSLGTTQSTVTWVLTAYLLSASVCTPILGRVGDMVGKKRVLVAVLCTLAIGSALAAVATSISVMIVARVIQGAGGGLIPLSFGIVRDEFPREKVASAIGVLAALLAVGGGLGLVLAGPIVNLLDYHWLFWIPGAVVAISAVVTHFVVPESEVRTPGRISIWAALLLSGWLIALLLAVSEAPSWGWGSTGVLALFVTAAVLAVAWIAVELHSANPLIDMRMMRLPAVWTTNLVALLFGFGMYSLFAFIPQFVQAPDTAGYGFAATITQSGLIVLPMALMMFVFGSLSGPLSGRFGARAVLITGSAVSVVPFILLAVAHQHIYEVALSMTLLGAGFGLAFSAMSNIVVDSVPTHQTGVASGMNANIRTIGGALGAALTASVITSSLQSNGLPTESGYTRGFLMLGVAAILATFAATLIPRTHTARDAHQVEQAEMTHAAAALIPGATIVGDEPE